MDEEDFTEDLGEHRIAKRARSLSPHQLDKQSLVREEEVEDDPSYRQLLASVRNLLDLRTPEESSEALSKIFGSKDRKRKNPVLPMVLPPVEEINNRWSELDKKVAGNPSDNGERLLSAPYNSDTFRPYTRPLMKFYQTTSSEFSTSAPKCQDSFRSICSKSSSSPPFIMSADIMASLCGVYVRVCVSDFSETTRPRDMLFVLKDSLSTLHEKLFKVCRSVCSSVC